jgi:hypothetical protein
VVAAAPKSETAKPAAPVSPVRVESPATDDKDTLTLVLGILAIVSSIIAIALPFIIV